MVVLSDLERDFGTCFNRGIKRDHVSDGCIGRARFGVAASLDA
jgi:hypothetical protein